ncbi:hypothetical protein K1T71_012733 [Dendrolimus kikuchii]|uniref:Uncharacterized protein n=1 Tax=Dendrolimus kikuchii TaxID=765133 RepID=A0ACC1CKD9_9NEOP|nr:hypothetical protein K1T71_012733 [Dendrolimus kikuchii]
MLKLLFNLPPICYVFIFQFLVALSPNLAALSVGGMIGYPNVLLTQLRSNSSTIQLDMDTASWIGSIHGFAGIPSILMPSLMQWKGRKLTFQVSCLLIALGWILAYAANTTTTILISESFHGLGSQCVFVISFSSVSEMVSPKFRNIVVTYYAVTQSAGIALVGIMGQHLHWKTVALIMLIPITLAFLNTCFMWSESPSWLALKGKFKECEKSFIWLRGNDKAAIKELTELVSARKVEKKTEGVFKTVLSRDFYIPAMLMFVLLNTAYWCGLLVIIIYSSEIIKITSGNKEVIFYGAIILNILLFICYNISIILMKQFNNKSVLLCGVIGTVISAAFIFIVTLLQSVGVLGKSVLCLVGLIAYMLSLVGCLISPCYAMAMEILPVKHRGVGGALHIIFTCVLHASSLKAAPYMFVSIKLWGTFLVYALNALVCGLIIWKYVPETKNRTLQELEDYFNNGNFDKKIYDAVQEPIVNSPHV